ncbi:ABC transporter ATP-binding protein [Streptomyces sp. NPDC085479]|uniref:ABC transporter ATP-binding protein n=1 Tax=Streptomyces sp. NPDC085479 TaxID=3365726 RepID=UPI0037D4249E
MGVSITESTEESPATGARAAEDPALRPPARLLRPYARGLAAVAALQVAGAVAGLAPLLAVVELGRTLLAPGPVDPGRVRFLVVAGAVGLFVKLVLTATAAGIGHLLDGNVQLALRRALAARLGRVPLAWIARHPSGELAKVVGDDVGAVHPLIAHTPGELTSAFVVPAVSLCYLLTVDWRLTLITLAPVLAAVALVPLMMTPARLREQAAFDSAMARIAVSVVEFVQGIAVVKAFGGGERAHHRFRTAADDFVSVFRRWVHGISPVAAGMQLLLSPPFVLLTVACGGAALIAGGGTEPADLLPFLLLGLGLTAPVAALGHGFDEVQAARRAAGRIREVLAVPPLPEPAAPAVPDGHLVELRGVRFAYDTGGPEASHRTGGPEPSHPSGGQPEPSHRSGRTEVLRGVDLVLRPGTVTALVGASGAGKSTLVRLLPRFADPTGGAVLLGGVDLRDLADRELYRRVAFVFQDVRLVRASVADNIALAVPEAGREAVERAARLAYVHDRVVRLPRGYDSVIGEDARLSGGEAQRIALARALLADTPVLVLDEATSFADPHTERAVRRTLDALRKDRTVLVVAHRLETAAGADLVAVLEDGVITEHGTPAELLASGGGFARLWDARQASPRAAGGERP